MLDKRLIKNFDFGILIIIILLACFGMIGIGVAMRAPTEGNESIYEVLGNINLSYVKSQALWVIIGLIVLFIVASIDYNVYKDMSFYIYFFVLLLLFYVSKKGTIAGNARRAIKIGPINLQPSEFAKLAIIISTAKTIEKRESLKSIRDIIPVFIQLIPPLFFIYKQPDLGTSLVLVVIVFGMLFVAGLGYKLILGMLGVGLGSIPIAWKFIFSETQKNRIRVFLNPELDPLGNAYNVLQSMTAIGSGRLYGKGLLTDNTLSQLNFLPAKHTDFIFAVTVEALGFIGGAIIIFLYMMLLLKTVRVAKHSKDRFGSLIVVGVASMMFFHIFENIGMTMGLMPVTGIPLPFMSYGGSSMLTNMAAYGMVLSVAMRRQKIKF
ncbi:MAG TPA: rod shape-determining protein RodA [Clostridiales bacterium]|nr:rod shape-determining protein RodA [Clostridiales bacterium]